MKTKLLPLIAFMASTGISGTGIAAELPSSFNNAKKTMANKVYGGAGTTIYTGCSWKKKKIDLTSCNLQDSFEKKWSKRTKRVEYEHVIPASWMYKKSGQERSCVEQSKGTKLSKRKYCQKYDNEYALAHNDLVNLYPSVGAVNAIRSAKPFASTVSGKDKQTFNGNLKTTITSRVIIPPVSIRGDIARIASYMTRHHGVTYSKRQQSLFDQWAQNDPVSPEELARCERIRKAQGRCVLD